MESADTLPALRALHVAKASIIDWEAPPKVSATASSPDDGSGPDYAIEDFGSDYGDDFWQEDEDEDDEEATEERI